MDHRWARLLHPAFRQDRRGEALWVQSGRYCGLTEESFADQLKKNTAVKGYAKLPRWFTVPTPLGSYNPDWAVDGERLYFVVETKSSLFSSDLRNAESAQIECGKAHFAALKVSKSPAEYRTARSIDDVLTSS